MIKNKIQTGLNQLGYKIERLDSTFKNNLLFKKILLKVKNFTMTNSKRIFYLHHSVNHIVKNRINGDIVECGVWKGGSVMAIAFSLLQKKNLTKNIYLFDTFTGMSTPTKKDYLHGNRKKTAKKLMKEDEYLKCIANIAEVKKNVFSTNYPKKKFKFIIGDVLKTLKKNTPKKISLLRLDTDWYESTKIELNLLYPKLSKGGVLIIDDYNTWNGCKKAVDEYFKNKKNIFFLSIDNEALLGIKF